MPDRRNQRNAAGGRHAGQPFIIEAPEVLQRAAATRDDQHIRAGDRIIMGEVVESNDRPLDLLHRTIALHPDRPEQHMARETVRNAVQHVADHRARRRSDDADHIRQEGNRLLALGGEQPFGGELPFPLLKLLEQRALARRLDLINDDLIFRGAGEKVVILPVAITSSPSSTMARSRAKTPFQITASMRALASFSAK